MARAGLEHFDKLRGTQFFVVLLGNFDAHLHVLRSATHHILQQRNTLLAVELAKVINDKLGVHLVAVLEDALDVGNLGVVLRRTLPHTVLLAKLSNVRAIVVRQACLVA